MNSRLATTLTTLGILLSSAMVRAAEGDEDSLGAMMKEAGWDKIVGLWVDPDTNGKQVSLRYSWRVKNHALAVSLKYEKNKSEALIGKDPKSGEVLHFAVDDKGGISRGKWSGEDGKAILTLTHRDREGAQSRIRFIQQLLSDDRLKVRVEEIESGDGEEFVLARKK